MAAQWIICQSLAILCTAWISLGEPQIKGKVANNHNNFKDIQQAVGLEIVSNTSSLSPLCWEEKGGSSCVQISNEGLKGGAASQQEQCVDNCSAGGKTCTKPCDHPFRGTMTFACSRGWWQKSTETCANLDVQSLLQRISKPRITGGYEAHFDTNHNSASGASKRSCTVDFSCITGDVLSAKPVAGNIVNTVMLLRSISSNGSTDVTFEKLKDYSKMASHILNGSVVPNWAFVSNKNVSSMLLESVVSFAGKLQIGKSPQNISDLFIATEGARINKNTPEKNFTFSLRFNNSKSHLNGTVLLLREGLRLLPSDSQAISVAFPTLGPILEKTLLKEDSVNGMVLSAMLPKELKEVSLMFEKLNKTVNSLCVAWNSVDQTWDKAACKLEGESSAVASCRCSYQPSLLQSFSILMSGVGVKHSALQFITYIGLVVSLCSLVLFLAIEVVVWHQVTQTQISYMRHVCLVNIAVSLLVADVLFIIVAFMSAMPRNHDGCVAATFFVHFFYLSLFFWMLALGLLILYGLLVIFWHLRKSTLLAVAFSIGYGCPSVIALLTVMITEPRKGYLRADTCWLNWEDTKALLAFIIPALLITGINIVVVLVVIARSGRSSIGDRSNSQDLVRVIRVSKNVVLLTPFLGITWGLGLATVYNDSLPLHIVFSLLNAFQGFLILLFGTLLDRKTRESLQMKCFPSKTSSSDTAL